MTKLKQFSGQIALLPGHDGRHVDRCDPNSTLLGSELPLGGRKGSGSEASALERWNVLEVLRLAIKGSDKRRTPKFLKEKMRVIIPD
jgi:hypothetical protein